DLWESLENASGKPIAAVMNTWTKQMGFPLIYVEAEQEWWTHLWLNEGFASWIEYLCVDHCFPEYDIWTQFVSADYTRAQELDALDNSHPIEVSVGHPSEVDEIFDAISYSKGASVIRMLHDYIGDKDFKKGMNMYLTKFQQKNAATGNL
ncbi:PREDICTED: puromycin-sensitive aminopeptidase-like, partial [Propithecus coquereli]|uniref:puromycin-sensitive aminopeptidase-like n=1 Tax=Propithecus coquereli TaxID=379532 RepID=UPI00063FCD18